VRFEFTLDRQFIEYDFDGPLELSNLHNTMILEMMLARCQMHQLSDM